jgi:aryl-alcohol dehydrogenase-like predicted oxidoreductase
LNGALNLMKSLDVSERYGWTRYVAHQAYYSLIGREYEWELMPLGLDEIAKETGKMVPQIALNWLLQRPTVSNVIMGARNEEQLRQNLSAVGWNLTSAQVAKLDAASATTPIYPCWHQRQFGERNPPPTP